MKKIILTLGLALTVMTVLAQWTDNGGYITTNDKVGIGLNPSAQFQIRAGTSATSYFNGAAIYNNAGNAIRSSLSVTSDDNGRINLYNNSTSLKVLINSYGDSYLNGGSLGIGTNSPNDGLVHIYRNATTGGIGSVNTANAGLRIQDNGSSLYIDGNTLYTSGNMVLGTLNNTTFSVGTNDTERLRIDSNGNVGFGTSSPSNSLVHIYRDATIGGIETPNTSNSGLRIQDNGHNLYIDGNSLFTTGNMFLSTINNTFFSIGTNNSERIRINANGNVGIGTITTGTHRLAVEGSIGAREIKVEANGWSDFVFENDYDLPTLEEVEQHIDENGHLPEIPSEAEVAENGINLGEMDAKLLQKIEELTLYLIEQNKELKTAQTEILELKKEVSALKNE
ncbi:hypothetical protein [Marinoscillum sp. 108]|uniref:hypothetical protein n=1 Tax=Marinoscillum sp. 108 TaxID=2653151 RepID=UPI00135BE379|nr:hypothetical protein [Marinoscillum sp. 108]